MWFRSSRAHFFLQGAWGKVRLRVGRYNTPTEVRKIDPLYIETKQMELILCPVLVVVGISASESKFSLHPLFQIVFIGV